MLIRPRESTGAIEYLGGDREVKKVGGRQRHTGGQLGLGPLPCWPLPQSRPKGFQLEQSLALHPPASGASTSLSLQGSSTFHSCQEVMASLLRPHSANTLLDAHGCTEESMTKCTQRVDVLHRSKPTDAICFSRCFPGNSSSPVYLDSSLPVALLSRWGLVFLIHGRECSEEHR